MPAKTDVDLKIEAFQRQYDSLQGAVEAYWDGRMPDVQKKSFELLPNAHAWIYAGAVHAMLREMIVMHTPARK